MHDIIAVKWVANGQMANGQMGCMILQLWGALMEISLENQWLCNVVVFIVVLRCGDTYSGYDSDLCGKW